MNKEEKAIAREQARQEYMQGMSYRQIAVRHGISVGLVAKWAKADSWEVQQVQQARDEEREQRREQKRERERRSRESMYEPDDPDDLLDYDVLRKSALLVVSHINQRLMGEKVLEPRDIKAITGALLDLKNQLNALSPRELREQALRLQALRKQAEDEDKSQEPVQVVFVNREWEDKG
jgi:hypothetical protein